MATTPVDELKIIEQFGPHLSASTALRRSTSAEPQRLVKTHCCFCGQQCGIQLKVKDNQVIGFEPWEDFPFNRGMLCPKGVRRYLQGSHHDRLTSAYFRDESSPEGFRAVPYDEAVRRVASEIQRIQSGYGPDAFAILGGASMTTEKCYLLGKFARVCLKTRHIDYNGRLCMVSAAAGNKKAFGIDRAGNPMSDIPLAEVIWIGGANVAECAPITTSYVWQARENGARLINVDPRITPLARTCDLILPIKPGRDAALFAGVLHLMIENDWLDHDFIRNHTVGFEQAAAAVREWTPRRTAEVTGIKESAIRQACAGLLLRQPGEISRLLVHAPVRPHDDRLTETVVTPDVEVERVRNVGLLHAPSRRALSCRLDRVPRELARVRSKRGPVGRGAQHELERSQHRRWILLASPNI